MSLQIYDEISGTLADRLRSGRLQVAIVFEDASLDGLRWNPVFEEELFLAVSPTHPMARAPVVDLRSLAAVPLAIPSAANGVRPIVDRALREVGLTPLVLVEANSQTVMTQVARSGRGGAILSASSVCDETDAGELVLLPLKRGELKRRAVVALSPVEPQLQTVELVFDLLEELARDLAGQGQWTGCKAVAR